MSAVSLPSEVWSHVLSFLDLPSTPKAARVCRTWHQLLNHSELWRTIHFRTYHIDRWIGRVPTEWRKHVISVHQFVTHFWIRHPKSPTSWVTLGTQLYREHRHLNESMAIFRQDHLFETDKDAQLGALCSLTNILLKLKKFNDCHLVLDKAFALFPRAIKAHKIRGDLLFEEGKFNEANVYYTLSLPSLHLESLLGNMSVAKELNDEFLFNRFRQDLSILLQDQDPILKVRYYALFSPDDCLGHAAEVPENHPGFALATFLRAVSLETIFKRTLSLNQANHCHFSDLELFMENVKKQYQCAIQLNPFHLKVIFSYVRFLEYEIQIRSEMDNHCGLNKIQELRRAIVSQVNEILLLNPDLDTYSLLAKHLFLLDNFEETKTILLQAKESGIVAEHLYSLLIKLLLKEKSTEKAEKLCREALATFNTIRMVHLFCEIVLKQPYSIVKYREAEEHLKYHNPSHPKSLALLGQLLEARKSYAKAEAHYRKAYPLIGERVPHLHTIDARLVEDEIIQNIHVIHMGVARCLHFQGKIQECHEYVLTAYKDYPIPDGFSHAEELLLLAKPTAELFFHLGNLYDSQWMALYSRFGSPPETIAQLEQKREAAYQKATALDPQIMQSSSS